ncbi:MAG: hypothetical protein FWD02_02925 [Bacteroidales bacterium]|nr:hypothetical protein [Bacteroidales bacterium]
MKKVLLVLAVAAFAVACGNAGQRGTAAEHSGCCQTAAVVVPMCCQEGLSQEECARRKAGPSCCQEGLCQEECARRKAGPNCCQEGLSQEECQRRKAAARGCSRAAGEGCKRGNEGCCSS